MKTTTIQAKKENLRKIFKAYLKYKILQYSESKVPIIL
jgi:3-methyladenine DNA glycosylase Tag